MGYVKIYSAVLGLITLLLFTKEVKGQTYSDLDENPTDIVYYRTSNMTLPVVKVVYGRPSTDDQEVFGTQVPFGKIWRTGSNESTEIKFYQDVMFGNKFVKAGTYVLYTIPNENYWTIILNKNTDTFGTCFYHPEDDVAKLEVPTTKGEMMETFSIGFISQDYGSQMVLAWAKIRVQIPLYMESTLITKI